MRLVVLFFSIWFPFTLSSQPPLKLKMTKIAFGFTSPVALTSPQDGSHRMFVIEQSGKIHIIKNGKVLLVPFLNISDKIDRLNVAYSEKGLLGLAFHPQYKTNGRFFIYYSAPLKSAEFDHQSVLAEYKVSENPDRADEASEMILFKLAQPESNHNGGCLAFGKDGYLYVGLGDGGGAGDKHGTNGNGQNLNTLLGKIIRIDVNGEKPYAIPEDNPFVNKPGARPEVYAYGLRNPWRFSFDRATGTLFCSDVGQNKFEETNIIKRGHNYGWRIMEGKHCYDPPEGCNVAGLTLPIDEYDHRLGISICGGYVYRGMMYPSLQGYYLFGDWSGKLFYLKEDGGKWFRGEILVNGSTKNDIDAKVNSFGEDENGEIYVITQKFYGPKSPTGAIYRLGF
ncbi:MAG: PQQ-dependent sugar dehydrogenase [Bacteroidia bacterium]|nr:PQQ-dependent sugar dehydrogenase [Bacteroidia bacterium]MCZ2278025.1 PQQ-dependent sugar dehydrogenase [Bacteroidia bacterium]